MSGIARFIPLVALLACCSCAKLQPLTDFGRNLTDYITGNTPIKGVTQMEDRYFPDERRVGINKLVDRSFGRHEPYTDRYMQVAQFDSDYLVRATAIRALNRSREPKATPVFIKALDDSSPLVRQEAAKALANVPDPNAAAPLRRLVASAQETRDVRVAAADALKHYRSLDVARALVDTLDSRDFGVAWQSRHSLIRLTGRDLRYDEGAWLSYLTGSDRPFS
jgi:HEAT repeat protein